MYDAALPEDIADHVHHFAAVRVDEQRVVPVTDPHRARTRIGQVIEARIDPILLLVVIRLQPVADVERPVVIVPERIEIDADVEDRAVTIAIVPPVIPAVVAPAAPVTRPAAVGLVGIGLRRLAVGAATPPLLGLAVRAAALPLLSLA